MTMTMLLKIELFSYKTSLRSEPGTLTHTPIHMFYKRRMTFKLKSYFITKNLKVIQKYSKKCIYIIPRNIKKEYENHREHKIVTRPETSQT